MSRLVLLCSSNRKSPHPVPAIELYRSEFFRLGRTYAWSFEPEKIFIMSAEYGLLPAQKVVEPYSMTMSALAKGDVKAWASEVVQQLKKEVNISQYEVIVLGLRKFAEPVAKQIPGSQAPLVGMSMPQALNFLRGFQE